MIITTGRKPSPKTRTFCKNLARFTGCEYVTRGKTSLSEIGNEPFLLVGQSRGNPGSFTFFLGGSCFISIKANVSLDIEIPPGEKPDIEGSSPLAVALHRATGFNIGGDSERIIRVNGIIEFLDKGKTYIKLKVLAVRGEGFG